MQNYYFFLNPRRIHAPFQIINVFFFLFAKFCIPLQAKSVQTSLLLLNIRVPDDGNHYSSGPFESPPRGGW